MERPDVVTAFLTEYVSSLPGLAAQFDEYASREGVRLDGFVESLKVSGSFFLQRVSEISFDPVRPLPIWWDASVPTKEENPEVPFDRSQLHWIDIYHAHVALLLIKSGAAYWSVFKGARREHRNGTPVLVLSRSPQVDVLGFIYGEALESTLGRHLVDFSIHKYFSERI